MKVVDIPFGEILKFRESANQPGLKVKEGLALARDFRDRFGLTDKETLDILNDRYHLSKVVKE